MIRWAAPCGKEVAEERTVKILVGVCGSVAAYRSVDFLRALKAQGHELKVVLTKSAEEFVSKKVLETFLGDAILSNSVFDESHPGTDHIATAKWADQVLIYGATAHFLAQYRAGLAGDFLLTQLLAFERDVYLMPAMNPSMWSHESTQDNVRVLKQRGVKFLGPVAGRVACGDEGVGHLVPHEEVLSLFKAQSAFDEGYDDDYRAVGPRVLISMGPMRTQMDPLRYIQNESSGLMGLELVRAVLDQGLSPVLLLGPVDSQVRNALRDLLPSTNIHSYTTAKDYGDLLEKLAPDCDIFYSASAVLDFEFQTLQKKLDRRDESFKDKLHFVPVKDFAQSFSSNKRANQWLVSFSAEVSEDDQELLSRALLKKSLKGATWTLINRVSKISGPSKDVSDAWIIDESDKVEFLGEGLAKAVIARNLISKTIAAWRCSFSQESQEIAKPQRH